MDKILYILSILVFSSLSAEEAKKRIVFIVNPISHQVKHLDVEKLIRKNLDPHQFEYTIAYTLYPQHATELTQEALQEGADIIAAVGGDGTVNEVGRALVDNPASLALIPVGSGNGLARHLGIPVGFLPAIRALNHSEAIKIDTAKINDRAFLGVAGIGFDAHVAHEFAQFGKRGFLSYLQVILRDFSHYKPQFYQITVGGKTFIKKAFILTFANSSQYGNGFIIAPRARIDDGYLDLVIIDAIPPLSVPRFLYQFRKGTLKQSTHFETERFKEITIEYPLLQAHLDGEPVLFQNSIKVTVQPDSLKIMVPTGLRCNSSFSP